MTGWLPIADAPLLGRAAQRHRLIRAGLTGAIALLAAVAIVLAARSRAPDAPVAPAFAETGRTTEIVVDVSGSIGAESYTFTRHTLERLSRSGRPVGLVFFSDSAEETLPPGTPPSQLLPFANVFKTLPYGQGSKVLPRPADYSPNPWYPNFSAGTRIEAGLAAGREALERDHVRGTILLISDLGNTPRDRSALDRELLALARDGIVLRVLAMPSALPSDRMWFEKLEGPNVLRADIPVVPVERPVSRQRAAGVSTAMLAVAALLALMLAANELLATSLRWREAR